MPSERFQAFLVLLAVPGFHSGRRSEPAANEEPAAERPSEEASRQTSAADRAADAQPPPAQSPQPPSAPEVQPAPRSRRAWHTDVNGYFRAPMALGISSRPGPDNMTGPSSTQVSYGPNRTVDCELLQLRLHAAAGTGLGGGLRPRKEEARRRRGRMDGVLVSVGRASGTPTPPGPRVWPISRSTRTSRTATSSRTSRSRWGPFGRTLDISRSTTPTRSGAFANSANS